MPDPEKAANPFGGTLLTEEFTRAASKTMGAMSQSSTAMAQGVQELAREWIRLAQDGLQRNLELLNELSQCQTLPDVMEVQNRIVRESMDWVAKDSLRIAELSVKVAREAGAKAPTMPYVLSNIAHAGEPPDYGADNE